MDGKCWHVLTHPTLLLCIVSFYGHVSQSEVQPLALDLRFPAPPQANITSATFVTPDNQFTSGQLHAPNAPEYQPIGELTYQCLQFFAAKSSWTPENLHACALERPDADLAFWVGSFWLMISKDFSNSSHSLSISKSQCQSVSNSHDYIIKRVILRHSVCTIDSLVYASVYTGLS